MKQYLAIITIRGSLEVLTSKEFKRDLARSTVIYFVPDAEKSTREHSEKLPWQTIPS